MKTVLTSIFAGTLMMGVAVAQDSATAPQSSPASAPQTSTQVSSTQATPVTRIAAGSVIPVSLTKTIDARKAVAKVTADMKSSNGDVILGKDTKVMGHVTQAQARSKEQKESQVAIAFDHAVMKNGSEMQMPMSIQAIIGPQNNNPQNQDAGGEAPAPSVGAGANAPAGRSMGGTAQPPSATTGASDMPSGSQTGTNARPPITAQTQGAVGIPDLKLTTTGTTAADGSVLSSEKNNAKIESGTMMLLRVSQ
jgi:hypothetical protein